MPTFVTLTRFTEQEASSFKGTTKRAAASGVVSTGGTHVSGM